MTAEAQWPNVGDLCKCEKCKHEWSLRRVCVSGAQEKDMQFDDYNFGGMPVRCDRCNSYDVRRIYNLKKHGLRTVIL